jgi:hypothetical protein
MMERARASRAAKRSLPKMALLEFFVVAVLLVPQIGWQVLQRGRS